MRDDQDVRSVRVVLIVLLTCLTAAMTTALWRDSRRAHFDSVWRAHRNQFEVYRHHRQQELAHQLATGEHAAEDLIDAQYDAEM